MNWFYLLLGLLVLIVGGEFLIKAAVDIAKKFRISTLVIGMTVVSFGTSAPELLVSLKAAVGVNPHPQIAIGNIIGSNIANLALVLGLTALIFPLRVERNSINIDWVMMFFCSLLFYFFSQDLMLVRWEGILMFSLLLIFTFWLIIKSRREFVQPPDDDEKPKGPSMMVSIGYLAGGMIGLYFGSEWLLKGAVGIAQTMGMSEHVIGVTIVAFGTSVPELVASGIAAFRKQSDISVGNLIGSNIFNIMAVLGLTSIVTDIPIEKQVLSQDMLWMLGVAFLILPIMLMGRKINRVEGAFLFLIYVAYLIFVTQSAI